jgi:hypothetical protein
MIPVSYAIEARFTAIRYVAGCGKNRHRELATIALRLLREAVQAREDQHPARILAFSKRSLPASEVAWAVKLAV